MLAARQMKTINYQLSSQRCLEEGWTLRPPSPLEVDDTDTEVFVPEPLHPAMIASGNVSWTVVWGLVSFFLSLLVCWLLVCLLDVPATC